ncbi:MAG: hypothetical protein A4E23_00041 [Methanomethylovorans sp. PtaU1.Bin073]|nr:MAG: hypothetical protein A4E23_00041 [Methanomethylovorans sp. PtaU1.Bin073]
MNNQQNPMDMMQMMMAGGKMPEMMQKCMATMEKMANAVEKSAELGTYATPELHNLFEEWLDKTSKGILNELEEDKNIEELAGKLGLSVQSINMLLLRLAAMGKVQIRIMKI